MAAAQPAPPPAPLLDVPITTAGFAEGFTLDGFLAGLARPVLEPKVWEDVDGRLRSNARDCCAIMLMVAQQWDVAAMPGVRRRARFRSHGGVLFFTACAHAPSMQACNDGSIHGVSMTRRLLCCSMPQAHAIIEHWPQACTWVHALRATPCPCPSPPNHCAHAAVPAHSLPVVIPLPQHSSSPSDFVPAVKRRMPGIIAPPACLPCHACLPCSPGVRLPACPWLPRAREQVPVREDTSTPAAAARSSLEKSRALLAVLDR